jgi:hypothetical protein
MTLRAACVPLALALAAATGCTAARAQAREAAPATLPAPPAPPAPQAPGPRTVHVTGEARVAVAPDVADITAGVEASARKLAQARAAVDAQMRTMMKALEAGGVAAKDVQTTRYDVSLEYRYPEGKAPELVGYRVATDVSVTVRDVARLGELIDRLAEAGSTAIRGLAFRREDPAPERAKALAAAYADARARAEVLARAAGATLGEALAIQASTGAEGPRPPIPYMAMAKREGGADAPVSPGEVEILATADVTFAMR